MYRGCGLVLACVVGVMASSNPAEWKGAINKIKRVQVDGLVSQDPLQ